MIESHITIKFQGFTEPSGRSQLQRLSVLWPCVQKSYVININYTSVNKTSQINKTLN